MEKILRTHEQILAVCYLQSYNFVKFKFNFYVIFTTNISISKELSLES